MRLNVIFSELVPKPSLFKLITRSYKVFLDKKLISEDLPTSPIFRFPVSPNSHKR